MTAMAAGEEVQMTDLCSKAQFFGQEDSSCVGIGGSSQVEEGKCHHVKKPRRVLHFSDGTLEEYSTDEDDEKEKAQPDPMALVDPKSLTWGPWMYYWLLYSGSSALAACDYVGESLAGFLGITSPKYQYEIDEYHRQLEEEKKKKEEEDAEMAGWRSPGSSTSDGDQVVPGSAVQHPPSPSHSLKQSSLDSGGVDTSPLPSVIVTSEVDELEVPSSDSRQKLTPLAAREDSADWERF